MTGAAFGLLFVLATPSITHGQDYSVIIRNGRVIDGTGNPWFLADVALDGDRIVAIGNLEAAAARREIDAAGLYVTPGFIDVHSHAGPGLVSAGLSHGEPLLAQGITTVLINPDGGGPVDLVRQRSELLRDGLGINVAQLVPHGSVRRAIIGSENRAPTAVEMEQMRDLVRNGMMEGAFGLSSGTFYVPGSYSTPEEIVELAEVIAEFGGTYTSHIRDESDYTVGVVAAVEEVINVARRSGIPGVVTHVKALGPPVWGFGAVITRRIEVAREEGVEVYTDQYPYTASATGLASALLPRWSQAGGTDSLMARFDRPSVMADIRSAIVDNLARRGGADRIQFRRVSFDASIEGTLLSELARQRSEDPVDTVIDLLQRGGASIISYNMDEDDLRTLMSTPWNMTASDGGLVPWMEGVPHPRSYGTFPRKIRHYVIEEGIVDLPSAIRSMTGLPAQVFRINDRGVLRPGAYADIVVFDLGLLESPATFTEPHQLARGMVEVFVGGETAISSGEFTGTLAGRVIRKGSPTVR
ncbi:MAG: amidohydrolase family protein [Gemmatimonadota bacterium]|nr:amidohydrolase family protein [Gemmatimonadota bacterium]